MGALPISKLFQMAVFVVVVTTTLGFCLVTQAFASTWTIQTLDPNTDDLRPYCPIVMDSNNNPHIAYTDKDFGVTYASWNGSSWNIQNVTGGTVFALALDAYNNPHILSDGGLSGFLYSSWTGSNWTTQNVDYNGTYFGRFGALTLDPTGTPHVAFTDNNKMIEYASWNGTNWDFQIVDTYQSLHSPKISLAIDSKNTVYILYESLSDVKIATYNNSSWTIQTVASNMDNLGNIVLDSKGYPHFIYTHDYSKINSRLNNTIVYTSWDGAAWNTQNAVSNLNFNMGYLSLDSGDIPHIAFVTSAPDGPFNWGFLAYASWTGKAWNVQTVNSSVVAESCFLALDSNGKPHISLIGVALGSPEITYTGAYSWVAPIMYVTKIEPTNAASSPTSSPYVPEFPSWVILPAFLVAIILAFLKLQKKL